jgi:hypothetical protein
MAAPIKTEIPLHINTTVICLRKNQWSIYTGIRHESGQVQFLTKACSGFLLDNSSNNFSTPQFVRIASV